MPVIALPAATITAADPRRNFLDLEGGALGAFVIHEGQRGFLTCNHVVAWNGRMPPGSPVHFRLSDGTRALAGTLAGFDRLDGSPGAVNRTDSALVLLDPGIEVRLDFSMLGSGPVILQPGLPRIGGRVIKYGPATGLTYGRIISISHDPVIYYEFGTYRFAGQLLIEGEGGKSFAGRGDSGAAVYSAGEGQLSQPVAIVWGGHGPYAYASPLEFCLARYGARLCAERDLTGS